MKMHKPNRWSKYLAAFLAAVMVLNSSSITAAADTLLQTETYGEDTAEQKAVVISGEDAEENSADQNETENEEQSEVPETPEQPDTNTTVDGEDQEKPETPETPETPSQSDTNTTVDGEDQEKPEIPETPSQSDTDATVDEDDQNDSEAPDQAMDATVTEEPTEKVEEVPAATKEDAEEEEEESFDGLLTIDELTALDDETVDATMWKSDGIALMSADDTEGNNWVFDAYYVNQDDPYYVKKTADFSLKYQMEFHTDDNLEIGAVQIRIPASIFPLRDGEIIMPSDIGVPHGTSTEDYKTSKTTPFNYYYEGTDENGKGGTLVFWNYKKISAGTNAAWQVLYKNLKVAEIKDQTKWFIKPEITVTLLAENEEDEDTKQTQATTPLEGIVDTQVTLNSVTKKPYSNGRSYTPGLYTESQVKSYLGYVPTDFADNYYVVWEVKVNASGNQPFKLDILDSTYAETQAGETVKGKIMVGSGTGVQDKTYIVTNYTASCDEDHDWNGTFTVVTAYPKSKVSVGDLLKNDVTVTLTPADGKDPRQTKSASAKWAWQNYTWKFEGNICRIDKYDNGNLAAALEILKIMSEKGQDYGSIPYTTQSYLRGYGYTHGVDSNDPSTLGVYKEGTYCETQVMDDFMAAYVLDEAAQWLDSDDYYYTKVSVEINDTGYDVWEDKQSALETPKGIDQSMTVYAMYAGKTEWEKVETIPWDGSGTLTYQFNEEQLAKKPWRVRVDHKTVNYSTTTRINVNVRLRHDSPIFTKILERYKSGEIQSFQLEDLSGLIAYGHVYEADKWQDQRLHQLGPNSDSYFDQYPKKFRDENFKLYNQDLPMRNNAIKELNGLVPSAESWKESKSLNDPDNSRTLINYTLKASDGYEVYGDEAINALLESDLPSPGRNAVAFYDLLPYGVQFNPSKEVKAYRISNGTKDDSQVSVKVDAETDYNGTGRTLLTFHIQYAGADSASYYYGKGFNSQNRYKSMWREAWQVDFQTYYDWKDIDQITNKGTKNIAAFMPEEEAGAPRYGQSLLGEKTEIYADDPNARPAGFEAFGEKLQPNVTYDDGVKNVLYMSSGTDNDVAISNQSTITKLVKADSDKFGIFTRSAVTEPNGTYTYEITVNNPAQNAINGIVVYDNLENASAERAGNNDPLQPFENGSWYGTFQSINTTGLETLGIKPTIYYNADRNAKTPNVTTEDGKPANVLTEKNGWYTKERWEEERKTAAEVESIAVDMGNFVLEGMKSISFQVKMTAPASTGDEEIIYAYNNPAFYSLTEGTNTAKTTVGNSTRVSLSDAQQLEVIKKIREDTPDVVKDNSFGFYLYEMDETENPDNTEKVPFAYQDYELYKTEDGGTTWNQEDGTYGTDGDGYLKLKANEKAVFTEIPDASRIHVEEEESPYWDQTIDDTKTAVAGIRTITFTNNYRRVLYAQKKLEGAPLDIDTTTAEFSFIVETRTSDEQEWSSLSNGTFWYVDSIRTDGGIPTKMTNRGDQGVGHTDENGIFKIKSGEIAAIFMGSQEVQYRLTEVQDDATGSDWICKEKYGVTGIVPPVGTSATITNIYRWKDLYLTKDITHQDAKDCKQEFTFQIQKVDADGTSTPVEGNTWEIMGADPAVKGTLDADGKFKAACAGQIVRIRGLEAGQNYIVTETDHGVDYQPVSDSVEVTMPIYSSSRNATITNDYLLRPLSVSKSVVYADALTQTELDALNAKDFTMTLTVDDEPWANKPYTVTENGKVVGDTQYTKNDGSFTIKNNQTATFAYVGRKGTSYKVVETSDPNYPQIYPVGNAPQEGTIDTDGSSVKFINGSDGVLIINKEYVGMDKAAQEYVEQMQKSDNNGLYLRNQNKVKIALYLYYKSGYKGSYFTGQYERYYRLNLLTGKKTSCYAGKPDWIDVYPWETIIIDKSQISGAVSYEIQENAASQHRIFQCTEGEDSFLGKWMEVSQQYPEEDQPCTGSVSDNPVATIVNQIKTLEGTKIEKRMAAGSEEVPVGANLVWRLEQFDGKNWIPAAGISYVLGDDTGIVSDKSKVTDENGELVLKKTENGYPWVQFPDHTVYVNKYSDMKNGDFRLVELLDKSDEAWGILVGYGTEDDPYDYSMSIAPDKAVAFVNANKVTSIEIEKQMEESSDESFTMSLEQVISASKELTGAITAEDITETRAAANMPYTIFDSDSNEEVGSGITTAKGELSMKAGQYVRLQVPENTYWTVREVLKPDFLLKGTSGNNGITTIGTNLLLLSAKAENTVSERIAAVFRNGQTYIDQDEWDSIKNGDFTVTLSASDGTKEVLPSGKYTFTQSITSDNKYLKVIVTYPEKDLSTVLNLEIAVPWDDFVVVPDFDENIYMGRFDEYRPSKIVTTVDGNFINLTGECNLPEYVRYDGQLRKVTGLGREAFYSRFCRNITKVVLPESVTKIGAEAFRNDYLEEIILPDGLTCIESNAFFDCKKLESMIIPDSVTKIGVGAFAYCDSLTHVKLPANLTEIAIQTFYRSKALSEVEIPEGVTQIGNEAFSECDMLQKVIIPDGLTRIGSNSFYECKNLSEMILPDTVTDIGGGAFSDCEKMSEAKLPSGLTRIANYLFSGCRNLVTVNIPEGVTSIGDSAFQSCGSLTGELKIPEGVTSIGSSAFVNCGSLTGELKIPEGITSIKKNTFGGCTSLTSVVIPETILTIEDSAFSWCKGLEKATIPNNLQIIGNMMFAYCEKLESVTLPENLTSIGVGAFSGCKKLANIEIPASVTSIGNDAFSFCESLKGVKIPEGVTTIGSSVFDHCGKLESVEIPASVTSIGNSAFTYCTSLKEVKIPKGVTTIESSAFSSCYSLKNVEIPNSVTSIGDYAFSSCYLLKNVEIPDSVTNIGKYAFWKAGLITLSIPKSVDTIGTYAFLDCNSLSSIEINRAANKISGSPWGAPSATVTWIGTK